MSEEELMSAYNEAVTKVVEAWQGIHPDQIILDLSTQELNNYTKATAALNKLKKSK